LVAKRPHLPLNAADTGSFDAFYGQLASILKNTFGTDHFDFLINNAGTTLDSFIPVATLTEEQFDEMYNIHLKGVFFLTRKRSLCSTMAAVSLTCPL
jgi:NAD(P)-dependent dehydrogenase (short-subunit alcohol dehydrogenase family)